jgi:hypothetical protein
MSNQEAHGEPRGGSSLADEGGREFCLRSDRLRVTLAAPGSVYRGSRFDWSTFVTEVTLDGVHGFCVPESVDADGTGGTGGIGLCCEWGIFHALGYDEARPGEEFLKPGVGLLTRLDDRPYSFSRPYPIRPFTRSVEQADGSVTLWTDPLDCRGWSMRLSRTLRVAGNCLWLESRVENVGRRPLFTDEYCHNFVAPGLHAIAPGLTLSWSRQAWPGLLGGMPLEPQRFVWTQVPPVACYTQVAMRPEPPGEDCWTLCDEASGLIMSEITSERWSRFALFSTGRLVSPEGFVDIRLNPGQSKSWWRRFEFSCV